MLNKLRLDYFLATVQTGSIRAAAKRLNIAASAISRQVNLLEAELGGRVLERLQHGVQPTELGLLLLKHCQKLEQLELGFKQEINNYHELAVGHISICVGEGFIHSIINSPLKEFNQRYQGINIDIDTGSTRQIINSLSQGHAHIGVMYQGDAQHDLHYWYSNNQPLLAIMAPGHALAHSFSSIALETIAQQQLILWRKGHGVRQLVDQGFNAVDLNPTKILETNSLAAIRHMVSLGSGITLLPACAVSQELADGIIVAKPVESEHFKQAKAHVVTRVGRNLSRSGLQLLRHLGQWMQSFSYPNHSP